MKKIVGGYAFQEQVARVHNATRTTRESLQQLIDWAPGTQQAAVLVAKASLAQTVILEAVREIETIAEKAKA